MLPSPTPLLHISFIYQIRSEPTVTGRVLSLANRQVLMNQIFIVPSVFFSELRGYNDIFLSPRLQWGNDVSLTLGIRHANKLDVVLFAFVVDKARVIRIIMPSKDNILNISDVT